MVSYRVEKEQRCIVVLDLENDHFNDLDLDHDTDHDLNHDTDPDPDLDHDPDHDPDPDHDHDPDLDPDTDRGSSAAFTRVICIGFLPSRQGTLVHYCS